MLDLDALAEQKARDLSQAEEGWRKAVWSEEFQRLSANMTDGEVEQLVSWCPSISHLQALVGHIESEAKRRGLTALPCLLELAKQHKLTPEEWIRSKLPLSHKS